MKKLLLTAICCILLVIGSSFCINAEIATSGSCGWALTWEYADGVLEISGEGKIYHYDPEKRPPWDDLKNMINTVIINEGVTQIGNYAFSGIAMKEVSLPSTLDSIHYFSFSGCGNLKSLYIPDSVTDIKEGAFKSCTGISELRLSPSVEDIAKECFYYCDSLTELVIPEGVKTIGDSSFGHNAFSTVTFPSSLTSIGRNSFLNIGLAKCPYGSYAESFARSEGYDIEYIGDISDTLENGMQWHMSEDTLTLSGEGSIVGKYPTFENLLTRTRHLVVEDGVTSLDGDLFRDFIYLEDVVFGKDVELIGAFCFNRCYSLREILFTGEKLRRIEDNAFAETVITELTLPEGTEYIGISAFSGCEDLTEVTLPDTVEIIGEAGFSSCHSLKTVTLPKNLIGIEKHTFSDCEKLESAVLSENIEYIDNMAFAECHSLKNILIPGNVKRIGRDVFYNCTALESVDIESGVEQIERHAFALCTSLTNITVPNTVSSIDEHSFDLAPCTFDCPLDSYAYNYAHSYGIPVKGEYSDVSRTAWYYESIRDVSLKGYMSGMGDNKFSPQTNLTRAQFVQLLFAMEGLDKNDYTGETGFTDAPEGKWFSPAVKWAKDSGITSGISEGVFGVNSMVTREQLARFMMKYAEYRGQDVTGKADISVYDDVSSVSAWAYDAIEWAVYEGIFTSMSDTSLVLAPRNYSTRAIAARVVSVFDTVINK
ncbi:MAG: leucine-rich repeat protein [Clostridia bacterium]|nr:leucine-rich repeat protein [Clostridia bacterium]